MQSPVAGWSERKASPTHALIMSIVPAVVGICAMTVLDSQLSNITREQFDRIFNNQWLRGLTLFGAAYASNGNRILSAAFAVYVYFSLISESFEADGAADSSRATLERPKGSCRAASPYASGDRPIGQLELHTSSSYERFGVDLSPL